MPTTTKPPIELTQTSDEIRDRIATLLGAVPRALMLEEAPTTSTVGVRGQQAAWPEGDGYALATCVSTSPDYVWQRATSSAGLIVSDAPPENPVDGMLWFNSLSGGLYTYYVNAWFEGGGGAVGVTTNQLLTLLGDGEVISSDYLPRLTPLTVTGTSLSWLNANISRFNRFVSNGAKTISFPATSEVFDPQPGDVLTWRNCATSGDITSSAAVLGVTLNYEGTANVTPPGATGSAYYVGDNVWDFI